MWLRSRVADVIRQNTGMFECEVADSREQTSLGVNNALDEVSMKNIFLSTSSKVVSIVSIGLSKTSLSQLSSTLKYNWLSY